MLQVHLGGQYSLNVNPEHDADTVKAVVVDGISNVKHRTHLVYCYRDHVNVLIVY